MASDHRSAPNPFEPSALDSEDVGGPPGAGKQVDVQLVRFRLERGLRVRTCLQCGAAPAGRPQERKFVYLPWIVYAGLVVRGIGLLILYYAFRRVVKTELALCRRCARIEKAARLWRDVFAVGAVASLVIGCILLAVEPYLSLIGAAGLVLCAYFSARAGKGAIHCKKITKEVVTLKTSPEWTRILTTEDPGALVGGRPLVARPGERRAPAATLHARAESAPAVGAAVPVPPASRPAASTVPLSPEASAATSTDLAPTPRL